MATNYSKTQNNSNQIEINNVITDDDTTEDTLAPLIIEYIISKDINKVEKNNDATDILRSSDQYNSLRGCFVTNNNTFKEMFLDDKTTKANINKNIDKTLYALIGIIVKEHLESLEQINFGF